MTYCHGMQVAVGEIHLVWPVEVKAAALFGNPQRGFNVYTRLL